MDLPCNKQYCVWYIGGFLRKDERNKWVNCGSKLKKVFNEEKLGHPAIKPGYHFHWESRCTLLRFLKIWRSPNTAAIIWVSHGYNGYPLSYDQLFEKRDPTPQEAKAWCLYPDGQHELPTPSRNLRALAIICCESHFHKKAWQKKIHRDAALKTFVGILRDTPKAWEGVTGWLDFKYHSNRSWGAEMGARYLLRNLRFVGPCKWPSKLSLRSTHEDMKIATTNIYHTPVTKGFRAHWYETQKRGPMGIA